ncbi:hypothetical protein LEN26_009572 [Aphanomyces euteiches]|nr:hypothetical protein LEN26_009572 [Aphanomyces euteiches]
MRPGDGASVGIDLGTTNSCVGVWKDGRVEIVANSEGHRMTPSCVAFTDSARLIGESAVNQAATNAANTVFGVKRLIGCEFNDRAIQEDLQRFPFTVTRRHDGKPQIEITYKGEIKKFLPEEISAMVLMKMKEIAEAFIEAPVQNAVITVPAYFSNSQRQATKNAGAIAGLNVLRVLNEPTAAAMAYGFHKTDQERNVLIYDLGGGTFDVSVVTTDGRIFEVQAVSGNSHLGGDDFDNCLFDYFKNKFNDKHGKDLSRNQRAVRRLRTACERAKRTLSSSDVKAYIEIDSLFDGIDFHEVLTRATFEDLCCVMPRCPRRKCGSTRIPKIQQMLTGFFGKKPCQEVNPDEAVAFGATVQAMVVGGGDIDNVALDEALLLDVVPLSLGVRDANGCMQTIIPRNTTTPTKLQKTLSIAADGQDSVTIQVFEGERSIAHDNLFLGQFKLEGIPKMDGGCAQIDITYDVDENGILDVSAVETSSGREKKITITRDHVLTTEEIERMVQDAERYKAEDEANMLRIEAKNDLEGRAYVIRDNVQRPGLIMSNQDKEDIESMVTKVLGWLDDNQLADREAFETKEIELYQYAISKGLPP